jgi:hypothetical protein
MKKSTNHRKVAFVGGYVTVGQRDRLRALATLRGESVNATLRVLIDAATANLAGVSTLEMQNRAQILADSGAVLT